MDSPLTFDLIVAFAFSFAIVVGALAGVPKLLLMLLALLSPVIVMALMVFAQGTDPLASLPPQSKGYAVLLIAAATLSLFFSVIWLVPGPRTAIARVTGILFAAALAVAAVGTGSLVAMLTNPALEETLRTKSLTGPAALTVGYTLVQFLPKQSELFQRYGQPKL